MKTKYKIITAIFICIIISFFCIGIGSVYIPFNQIINILLYKIFNMPLKYGIENASVNIVWSIRFPRVLFGFLVGACLGISGSIMQSVLKNPLASSFTLGVSSGAALGASLVIIFSITLPFLGIGSLPLFGLIFGSLTVVAVVLFVSKIDPNMENQTIILTGMVVSLFINAIQTTLNALSRENMERIIFWQMGSLAQKNWSHVIILTLIVLIGFIIAMRFSTELDILTFGEEQAMSIGVDVRKIKWAMLILASALTGSSVAFSGIIGFIDLISPHIVRKIFGSTHKFVLPMSGLFGGTILIVADLIARTIISPNELPIGAVTALIGAPFFGYVFFRKRKGVL